MDSANRATAQGRPWSEIVSERGSARGPPSGRYQVCPKTYELQLGVRLLWIPLKPQYLGAVVW